MQLSVREQTKKTQKVKYSYAGTLYGDVDKYKRRS